MFAPGDVAGGGGGILRSWIGGRNTQKKMLSSPKSGILVFRGLGKEMQKGNHVLALGQ